MKLSVVIPAHNEAEHISTVIAGVRPYAAQVIVVDDASDDDTARLAAAAGAEVLRNEENRGYAKSVETGLAHATNELVLTMDADNEHEPSDIPAFTARLEREDAILVIGKRTALPRKGERIVSAYFHEVYGVSDVWNGMRLLKRELLGQLVPFSTNDDYGLSFVHDALRKGKKVVNCPLSERDTRPESRIGRSEGLERSLIRKFIRILQVDSEEGEE